MGSVRRRFRADTAEKMMPLGRISPLTTLPSLPFLPSYKKEKGKSPLSVAQFPSLLPPLRAFPFFVNRVLVVAFPLPFSAAHSGFCEG